MVETVFNPVTATIGQEIPIYRVHIAKMIYRKYNRIIKEINPIHISKSYAQNLGYDDIVVAGNFLFTYIPKWISDWIKDVNVLKKITVKFENPVYIDEEIIHTGKIVDISQKEGNIDIICEYTVKKPDGLKTSYGEIYLMFNTK